MHSYTPLPEGSVRLLRLLPSSDAESRIECRLLTFSMLNSEETHPYEALSYVWGEEKAQDPIYIDSKARHVTANLYAALSCLRHYFLERVLWIDAVCINQDDTGEKNRQVQSMAKIYAKASRVIVWLGEATDDGARALEAIRIAAHRHYLGLTAAHEPDGLVASAKGPARPPPSGEDREAVLRLLGRSWFRRVWVLQEVAAARHVLTKCGPVEVDGYAFCVGVNALKPYRSSSFPTGLGNLINSVAYLIGGAGFRPRPENGPAAGARFSLNIRLLCELVDIYQDRQATDLRDKVYALLGMSSDDDVDAAGLSADYAVPWRDVFRNLIRFWLSDRASIATWDEKEVAAVEAKGHFLGQVTSVSEDETRNDGRRTKITWKHRGGKARPQSPTDFIFQASVKVIKEGDIVCLLEGASALSIVRLGDGYSTIIVSTVPQTDNLLEWIDSIADFPASFLLIWDWREMQAEDYEGFLSGRGMPKCPVARCKCQDGLDKAARWWNTWLLLNGMERYGEATNLYLRKAVEIYNIAAASRGADNAGSEQHASWRKEDEGALKAMEELRASGESAIIGAKYKDHSLGPLQWASSQGCHVFARLVIEHSVNIEAKDAEAGAGETPLQWASRTGNGLLLRLLIARGADTEAKYGSGQTPLQKAVAEGNDEAARLLAAHGANTEVRNQSGETPLWTAAACGHENIVRTLAVHAGADVCAENISGDTPLHMAAIHGHVEMVRVLVAEAGADRDGMGGEGRTPLHCAARYGHVAVVRLLVVELGADMKARDGWKQTPLHLAAHCGHVDVVRLLVMELGADKEARNGQEQTPLHMAAMWTHVDVVRLLVIELGADKEARERERQTPLHYAVQSSYTAVIKLLVVELGADIEARDGREQTPLYSAVRQGWADVVRLLVVELGADKEARDWREQTPLHCAVQERWEPVVRLLVVELGANKEVKDCDGRTPLDYAVGMGDKAIAKLLAHDEELGT